jgi:protein-disulfide isomerase
MPRRIANFAGLALGIVLFAPGLQGQEKTPPGSRIVASVNGKPITAEELNRFAASELEKVEIEKRQLEANYLRGRQEVLEGSLDRLIEQKLIAAEAAKRGITEKELLAQEVDNKIHPPSAEEVNAFYESNKARITQPKEQIRTQIEQFLLQQARNNARSEFIRRLKQVYPSESYLEPLRFHVESANAPSRGSANAAVTLVEFSDFQCPYCKSMFSTLREIRKNYPENVRMVFRQFPLISIHSNAQKAAEASLCSHEQGRFWEMYDALFEDQTALKEDALKAKAALLKLDAAAFNACLDSGKYSDRVKQDLRDGSAAGVSGTPALFINGRLLSGAQPYQEIAKIIDEELKKKSGKH